MHFRLYLYNYKFYEFHLTCIYKSSRPSTMKLLVNIFDLCSTPKRNKTHSFKEIFNFRMY